MDSSEALIKDIVLTRLLEKIQILNIYSAKVTKTDVIRIEKEQITVEINFDDCYVLGISLNNNDFNYIYLKLENSVLDFIHNNIF